MGDRNLMDVLILIEKCRELGATFIPLDGRFKVQAPQPLPDDIIAELKEAKPVIMAELQRRQNIKEDCWILEEWRRISIPEWRRTLQESILNNDLKQAVYSRWMLREFLEDPEYSED
jgi:hypothetical protein